jgi:enterobacteria phage integrase
LPRDVPGPYRCLNTNSPPTRSLGGALLIEKGWTKKQVQALMTHTSESMTEHYLEGHDIPWTEVKVS